MLTYPVSRKNTMGRGLGPDVEEPPQAFPIRQFPVRHDRVRGRYGHLSGTPACDERPAMLPRTSAGYGTHTVGPLDDAALGEILPI